PLVQNKPGSSWIDGRIAAYDGQIGRRRRERNGDRDPVAGGPFVLQSPGISEHTAGQLRHNALCGRVLRRRWCTWLVTPLAERGRTERNADMVDHRQTRRGSYRRRDIGKRQIRIGQEISSLMSGRSLGPPA